MTELESWSEWLSGPECRTVLENAARFVFRMAAGAALPPGLLPCRDPWGLPREERDACFQSLSHDLWLFLRSRPPEWVGRMGAFSTSRENPRPLMLRMVQEFFHHLKDQARTSDLDPKRALYRRMRQVLHEEPAIAYRATREGAFYALDPDARWSASWQPPHGEPYGAWESPLAAVALKDLHRRSALMELARFFWRQATERVGEAFFLPVRELVHFISCHYSGLSMREALPLPTGGTSRDGDEHGGDDLASDRPAPDLSFMESRIPALAEQLVSGWTWKQRLAFVLLQGEGAGLKEAAESLGYKSPSGVAYLYRSVCDSLRDFCLLWPGISPPDLDSRLFEAFVLEVVKVCKKRA